ncbi:dihydrolipoyl dehydrogenase [Cyclospora cayetanensis]|uniref:Dihydrolipoyl dehydrogenase n=1 Tax=Cyclospora cayetanensis TaxID=88456 RepID=A0A1D3D6F9_9EIME|nr:dihydrolipoyl dehydrogenase [Cyclospora cayetanensis]
MGRSFLRSFLSQNLGLEALGVTLKRGGFVPVDACMRVLKGSPAGGAAGASSQPSAEAGGSALGDDAEAIDGLYCIGDANGLLQLAHAASAQAVTAVEAIAGRNRPFNSRLIPAACFTNPEIAFVGYTEPEARALGEKQGFEVGVSTANFRANSKAVAEGEAEGLMKVLWRKDSGQVLGCHMIGPHAGDLMQQCANAMATQTPVDRLAQITHTHPTLSETVEAAWKQAVGLLSH